MSDYYSPVVDGIRIRRRHRARAVAQPHSEKRIVDLGRLSGHHLGYLIRRAQIWIFQDFIRTLAEVRIRPAQYSVLLVIEANAGLSQSALARTLGDRACTPGSPARRSRGAEYGSTRTI